MQGLNQVKKHIEKGQKVIFLPLYKTFIDFFVMVYVNQTQGIPNGFTFGNHDDIPKILIMKEILRRTGYISSRRKQGQSVQSSFVNSTLMQEVIAHN